MPVTHTRITRDPKILMGKPCIIGTRISVETILRRLSAGLTPGQVAGEYPGEISVDDVLAALAYAADYMRHDGLIAAE